MRPSLAALLNCSSYSESSERASSINSKDFCQIVQPPSTKSTAPTFWQYQRNLTGIDSASFPGRRSSLSPSWSCHSALAPKRRPLVIGDKGATYLVLKLFIFSCLLVNCLLHLLELRLSLLPEPLSTNSILNEPKKEKLVQTYIIDSFWFWSYTSNFMALLKDMISLEWKFCYQISAIWHGERECFRRWIENKRFGFEISAYVSTDC